MLRRVSATSITLEQFLFRHRAALVRVARRYFRSQDDAEDCVQDACVHLLRSWNQASAATRFAWAIAVVRNRSLDILRKRRSHQENSHVSIEQIDVPVRDHGAAIIAKLTLEVTLGKVSPKQNRAIQKYLLGEQASGSCQKSTEKAARSRAISRMRSALRRTSGPK